MRGSSFFCGSHSRVSLEVCQSSARYCSPLTTHVCDTLGRRRNTPIVRRARTMTQREGRLVYGPGAWYALHGMLLREAAPLDLFPGTTRFPCPLDYRAAALPW